MLWGAVFGRVTVQADDSPKPWDEKCSYEDPCGSAGKESTRNAGDLGLIPGLGRWPGEEKGYPVQYSGLENSMDCIVRGVAKNRTLLFEPGPATAVRYTQRTEKARGRMQIRERWVQSSPHWREASLEGHSQHSHSPERELGEIKWPHTPPTHSSTVAVSLWSRLVRRQRAASATSHSEGRWPGRAVKR